MDPITTVLVLLLAVAIFALLASKIGVPYPTMMVLGGLAICFIPTLRAVDVAPEVIFKLFLPPLLYGAAWQVSWKDFRSHWKPIALMAIGLVLFTMTGCAWLAMMFIPGFTWASAFALGAVLSPPDAIAVSALTKKIRLPKRLNLLLEGESLVNDASALVALNFAILIAVTGATFSLPLAVGQFAMVSTCGIAIGLVIGWTVCEIHRRLDDSLIETMITFLTPYAAYLFAEQVHCSGVLATVTAGLYLSWRLPEVTSADTRLQMRAVWDFVLFVLNGLVFVLVGLGLPSVLRALPAFTIMQLIGYGCLITAGTIGLRMLWVIPGAYLPRLFSRRIRREEKPPPLNQVILLGWVGMRGAVSLAAALAVPAVLDSGNPFPNRGVIIFLAFFLILVTMVVQSLTLPFVVRLLGVKSADDERAEERDARLHAAAAALAFLRELTLSTDAFGKQGEELREAYVERIARLRDGPVPLPIAAIGVTTTLTDLRREALQVERQAILELRAAQKINTELYQQLMADIDREELRLHTGG